MKPHPAEAPIMGFTLIELMIAVAVVAILATIAYPAYTDSIRKSRRSDARNALLDLAARQERYFNQNNTYTATLSKLGYTSADITVTNKTWYTVTIPTASGTAFKMVATPKSGTDQVKDSCYAFVVDHLGQTTNLNSSGSAIAASAGCW